MALGNEADRYVLATDCLAEDSDEADRSFRRDVDPVGAKRRWRLYLLKLIVIRQEKPSFPVLTTIYFSQL